MSDPDRPPPQAPGASRRRRDGGFSVVEIMVSITLLGLAAASVLAGAGVAISVSAQTADRARADSAVQRAADLVTGLGWLACPETDATGGYDARAKSAADDVGWPASTISVTDVEYWQPALGGFGSVNPVPTADCGKTAVSLTKDRTMQRVTIQAVSPSGDASSTLSIVVGDLRADEETP